MYLKTATASYYVQDDYNLADIPSDKSPLSWLVSCFQYQYDAESTGTILQTSKHRSSHIWGTILTRAPNELLLWGVFHSLVYLKLKLSISLLTIYNCSMSVNFIRAICICF